MLNAKGVESGEFLEYKGRPLVRKGDDIYYGDLSDAYHVFMMIMMTKPSTVEGVETPEKIVVQLMPKNERKPEKQAMKNSLTEALDIADAWLTRYNNQ